MSHFSDGQVNQLANALEAAGWSAEDVTRLGQAGKARLTEIRLSLLSSDIVSAIETGTTELWLIDEQKTGWVRGHAILTHLTETGLLTGCADLAELEAIKVKGVEFFRRYFRGQAVFGWRGVQDDHVPCLFEINDKVVFYWNHLGVYWRAYSPALRRK